MKRNKMSEHGMHIDDHGLTAKTEVPSAADAYLPAEFTRPTTKQSKADEYAELPGSHFLPEYESSLIYLAEIKGKTEVQIAKWAKVKQPTINEQLATARSAYSFVQSDFGLPIPKIREICQELGVENLYAGEPTSLLIDRLVHFRETPFWMIRDGEPSEFKGSKTLEKQITSALRQTAKICKASAKYKPLGDLISIHLRWPHKPPVIDPDEVRVPVDADESLDFHFGDDMPGVPRLSNRPKEWIDRRPPTPEEMDEDDLASSQSA